MQAWIIEMMNQFGYIGVAGLIALENIFPPIPSEVILTFGGFMTTYTTLHVWGVIVAATAGSMAGALILYGVGRFLKPERLKKLLSGMLGRILRLEPDDIDDAIAWFNRRGNTAVFFCRFIPIIRSLISLPAGTARMNLGIFLILTAIGSAIWNTVLVWLGAIAGASWSRIVVYMDTYTSLVVVIIIALLLLLAARFIRKRFLAES